jgi:hypothetical protein
VAAGDGSADSKMSIAGMILTVLLLVMLYLMVFQPGL